MSEKLLAGEEKSQMALWKGIPIPRTASRLRNGRSRHSGSPRVETHTRRTSELLSASRDSPTADRIALRVLSSSLDLQVGVHEVLRRKPRGDEVSRL